MKVMLVDDHPLFLEGLQNLLEAHGILVAGTAADGHEAMKKARELEPDVILMDIAMPGGGGLEAILPIKTEIPDVKIIMLTAFDDDDNLFEAVKRGASGYLLKNLNAGELISLLYDLEQGHTPLSPGLAARLLEEFARNAGDKHTGTPVPQNREKPALTSQQTQILSMVSQGKTYKEIGASLSLTERTIKYHMERILDLLHVDNRAQAIAFLARQKENPID